MKIDFSVVIPLYNKAKEIVHTLEGVASQRYAPLEVIVVDDGSTDGGAELVEQMKVQLPTLQLIRQVNGGVSVARNCGIAHARGNYVALLDADDFWKPEYLERVAGVIERYPGCGMYCMGFEVHRPEGVFPNEMGMQEGIVTNYFQTAMHVNLTQTSSVTIPRAVFEQLGGFPEGMKLGEDQYVWTKIALKGQKLLAQGIALGKASSPPLSGLLLSATLLGVQSDGTKPFGTELYHGADSLFVLGILRPINPRLQ